METAIPFTVILTYDEIEHLDEVMRTKVGRMLDMRTQEGEIINKILMQVYNEVKNVANDR